MPPRPQHFPPPFARALANERHARSAFIAAIVLGIVLLTAAGPAPQLIYPSDVVAYLDACHRSSLGQWLGEDFRSPIGPAALLPTVLAMRLGGANVQALALGSAFVWTVYGLLAWTIARPRMSEWSAAGFALFVASTAAAPYTLDFGNWRSLSYAMLYNRLAWAALAIAAVAALLPRTDGSLPKHQGFGFGLGVFWLWAIKPNYLVVLAPLALWTWLCATQRGRSLLSGLLGVLTMLAIVWLGAPFSPSGYVETHLGMAGEAPFDLMWQTLARSLGENGWIVLGLLGLWTVALKTSTPAASRTGLALTIGALVASTFLANMTNCQYSEIPLWGALGWVVARRISSIQPTTRWMQCTAGLGLLLGLGFMWQPVASIGYSFVWKIARRPSPQISTEVASPAWHNLPMRYAPGAPADTAQDLEFAGHYAVWLNDGLGLLSRVGPVHGSIACLDWVNPFPFATQTAPAKHDEIAWHVGRTVGLHHHPEIGKIFAGTGAVMEPRRSIQPDSLAFKRALFAPILAASFELAGESTHWRIWVRRKTDPQPQLIPPRT